MRCDTGNLTLPRCGIHPCGARGLRSECHAHPGRSLRASACAAGKLVDRFAFPALAPQSVVAFADIAAVVVSCLMIMSFSGKIRNRKNKKLYVVMLGGYNIILTCTFVHRTLAVLWK